LFSLFKKGNQFFFVIDIKPTGRKAKWTAAGLFKLNQEGKITL
jgi:hypothetical protein